MLIIILYFLSFWFCYFLPSDFRFRSWWINNIRMKCEIFIYIVSLKWRFLELKKQLRSGRWSGQKSVQFAVDFADLIVDFLDAFHQVVMPNVIQSEQSNFTDFRHPMWEQMIIFPMFQKMIVHFVFSSCQSIKWFNRQVIFYQISKSFTHLSGLNFCLTVIHWFAGRHRWWR